MGLKNTWEPFLSPKSIVMGKKAKPQAQIPVIPKPAFLQKDSLDSIAQDLVGCQRCKLSKTRTHIVVGEGNPNAELIFVGEGPGEQEDLQGRPFVGRAGQLLDKMIQAIGLQRESVYICNVVKCRPPENRNPEPDEIASCGPFLLRQVGVIQPKIVVTLGKFATQTLLQTEERITSLRGNFFDYQGAKLIPTYHPAYLLRNPPAKREAWEDLKKVAKELGLKIPTLTAPAASPSPGGK